MAPHPRQTLFAAVFQPLEGFTCFGRRVSAAFSWIPAPCLLTLNQDLSFIHVDSSDCVAVFEPYSLFLGEGCFSSVAVLMLDGDL